MAITDFISALEETRAALRAVNAEIDQVEYDRQVLSVAPPHASEIVEALLRGLKAATSSFETQLGYGLNNANATGEGAVSQVRNTAAQLLTIDRAKPAEEYPGSRPNTLFANPSLNAGGPDLNAAAVTYFLRGRIEAEIPALVDKLCPAAREGIMPADRAEGLRQFGRKLTELCERRDALQAELGAARRAVHP